VNIELSGLTRRFGRYTAVDAVTLAVGPGVFGLLGPNGAGKTSMLRVLATILPPSSGKLTLLGRDPARPGPRREIRRRLGYLPQNLGYYPGFTVTEFVEYFALLKEMPPARVPEAVAAAIEKVGLDAKARTKLRTLSGGMLRRAGIAQAIVNDPELLLFDEPTAGLDPEQRVEFRALMRALGEHATVIVSTHLVEDVGAACSQLALMASGKIACTGFRSSSGSSSSSSTWSCTCGGCPGCSPPRYAASHFRRMKPAGTPTPADRPAAQWRS
jgi:ABC-2 type transport system ATP-binding protein